PGLVSTKIVEGDWLLLTIRVEPHFLRRGQPGGVSDRENETVRIYFPIAAERRNHGDGRAVRVHRLGMDVVIVMENGLPLAGELTQRLFSVGDGGAQQIDRLTGQWIAHAVGRTGNRDHRRRIVDGN